MRSLLFPITKEKIVEFGEFRDHRLSRTIPVQVVQHRKSVYGKWIDYWEYADDTAQEAEARRDAQRLREEGDQVRTITRRKPNPDFGRFREGMYVKIHPSTTRFAQGFRYGRVKRVGFAYVTVVWSGSDEVVSKFIPEFLAPQLEAED